MNQLLHRHGFVYKKPKGRPHKSDTQRQQDFVEHFELLKKRIKDEDSLYFIDAVHPTQSTKLCNGWIKKGVNKHIDTTASRTRLNIVGAIKLEDLRGAIVRKYETINADSLVLHMKSIREQHGLKGTVYIVLDQAGYHRCHLVRQQAFILDIKLHYLPPYSPNLNPIERLWEVMNEHVRNNRFFKSAEDFKESIMNFFTSTLPQKGSLLNTRINDNFEII